MSTPTDPTAAGGPAIRRGPWRASRRARRLVGVALLGAAASIVFGAWRLSGDLHCNAPRQDVVEESNYGEATWSWFPLGTACRWTESENGFDRVESPGWVPSAVIAAMVIVGLGLVATSSTPTAGGRRSAVDGVHGERG